MIYLNIQVITSKKGIFVVFICVMLTRQFIFLVFQVLNRIQSKGGGLKLYTPPSGASGARAAAGGAGVAAAPTHHRTTYVVHQDNQPS